MYTIHTGFYGEPTPLKHSMGLEKSQDERFSGYGVTLSIL